MSIFAIGVGIYTYLLFFLGITGNLFPKTIIFCSLLYGAMGAIIWGKKIGFPQVKLYLRYLLHHPLFLILTVLICLLAGVTLIGVLGPEIGFDALWYHLTIPKIFLQEHRIFYIPGGLLYYSTMPKLAEMLYVAALSVGDERVAKGIQFLFGILTVVVLYRISRKYLSPEYSLLTCLIYYSNLLVLWESTSAYIDLIWTFFETMAIWYFVTLPDEKKGRAMLTGSMMGFAISTKLLAIRTFGVLSTLIVVRIWKKQATLRDLVKFIIPSLLIPMPWFIFAYLTTGNPVYPLFSPHLQGVNQKVFSLSLLNPLHLLSTSWTTFTSSSDPISPVYLMLFPLLILTYRKMKQEVQVLVWYALLGFIAWYFTSGVEGARMLLPYLPVFSLITVISFSLATKTIVKGWRQHVIWIMILITVGISFVYRAGANAKYVPYILRRESKAEFMKRHLDFSFGEFYDIDGYLGKQIKSTDKVLLVGFHNLYYIDFPFFHDTWVKQGDHFNYIATQNTRLPGRFSNWKMLYNNPINHVSLYTNKKQWETY